MEAKKHSSFPKSLYIILILLILALLVCPTTPQAQDAFGSLFGGPVASSSDNQTGVAATSGGFTSPSPIQDERTTQKDKDGRSFGI